MRKTKEDAEKTKADIIEAAIGLFEDAGFEKTSMEAIAQKAGVTRGAIYWHFDDKAAVLAEIINGEHSKLDVLVAEALSPGSSPFRMLRRLVFSVVDLFYDDRRFRQFIKITWYKLSSAAFEDLLVHKSAFVEGFLETMRRLLEQAKENKEIDAGIDVQQMAFHLSCLINGFYRLYFAAPSHARAKKQTADLFEAVFSSLKI